MKAILYDMKKGIKKQVVLKTKPVIIAYGTCNLYAIDGSEYYRDIIKPNLFVKKE